MAAKKQTAFRLNEDTLQYLMDYKESNQLSSMTKALELIVQEHKASSMRQTDAIANRVVEIIENKYGNAFTRVRLAARTADINSQIMLEILNSFLHSSSSRISFISTDTLKHEILENAQDKVKAKIAYYKQKNDDKKKGKKKDER